MKGRKCKAMMCSVPGSTSQEGPGAARMCLACLATRQVGRRSYFPCASHHLKNDSCTYIRASRRCADGAKPCRGRRGRRISLCGRQGRDLGQPANTASVQQHRSRPTDELLPGARAQATWGRVERSGGDPVPLARVNGGAQWRFAGSPTSRGQAHRVDLWDQPPLLRSP